MTLKVVLKGHSGSQYKEADAAESITPGHLVDLNSSGKAIKQVAARKPVNVAIENHWVGGGLSDPYVTNDRVVYQALGTGVEFQALIKAAGAAIAYGDLVKADTTAAGCICVEASAAVPTVNTIGRALQAVDNSAGGSQARIRIELL